MLFVDQIDCAGKRVLLRADLNVPIDETTKQIADDTRIKATIPTIELIRKKKGRVILCSHLGSPKGKVVPALSLAPVAKRLEELLNSKISFGSDCVGGAVSAQVKALKDGEVLLLENLRFHAGEEANDPAFSGELASLGEIYVNDAFGTAHRAHASTVGVVEHFSVKAGGLTLKNELSYFAQAFENPARPFMAVFGGVKISTKLAALKNVGQRADKVIIGGAMANTLLVAQGKSVGKSLYEANEVENAREILSDLSARGCEVILPVDLIVAAELKAGVQIKTCMADNIPSDMMALDIGPQSSEVFRNALADAKTIIWNGPLGAFETAGFEAGTYTMIDTLASSKALTVVGGGDTDLALHEKHAFEKMDYVSTGGGAFLKLLEGKTLPAVAALG